MAIWGNLALSYPIRLLILIALQPIDALKLTDESLSSLNSPQIIARAEDRVIVKPYAGNGAPPVATTWDLLTTSLPLQYSPTASNSTLRLTLKNGNAQNLDESAIYNLTVLSLADIAISTASTKGSEYIRPSSQRNSTFATSFPPSILQFMVTAIGDLPIYVITDVLRAMQELTHYLYFLELSFEVFGDTDPTSLPLASGCLARDCGSQPAMLSSRDLDYANLSATNLTSAPSRRLQAAVVPIQLTQLSELQPVAVTYDHLMNALPISEQTFADVADGILAKITDLMIANQGDGLLPFYGNNQRRLIHSVDTWGSELGISLLPSNIPGKEFTLARAAMALQATQKTLGHGSMVESRLTIMQDNIMVGWGCLRYQNTSAFRCIMPSAGTFSSTGSGSASAAANDIIDVNTAITDA